MNDGSALGSWTIGSTTEPNLQITHGEWPSTNPDENTIPVLISERMPYDIGIQIGDRLIAERNGQQFVLEVVATWTPSIQLDDHWILQPRVFEQVFLVSEAGLEQLTRTLDNPVNEVTWFHVYDGSALRISEIDAFLAAMDNAMLRTQETLPQMRLDSSPAPNLRAFQENANRVLGQTFATLLPIYGVIFFFIALVSSMLVRQQHGDDRKLRMRGLNSHHILEVHLYMWLIISVISFVFSLIVSPAVVFGVAGDGFNVFGDYVASLQAAISSMTLLPGMLTSILTSSFGLVYAYRNAYHHINHFADNSERARVLPIQGIEFILVLPAIYTLWQYQQGGFTVQSPFENPLVFIAPSLLGVSFILLTIRLFPLVLRLFEWSIRYTTNISALLALRELTRSSGTYFGTLFMIAMTLCLMAYIVSTISTYEHNQFDTITYDIGGDMQLVTFVQAQQATSVPRSASNDVVDNYILPPVEELGAIEGIDAYMRVGVYDARLQIGTRSLNGLVIGVDREGLATVMHFRNDFSTEPIGNLSNRLALERSGILLSQNVIKAFSLRDGQDLRYQVFAFGEWQTESRGQLVGTLEYFPTINPNDYDFFFVTNLQTIFENVGTLLPYNVWLALLPTTSSTYIADQLRTIQFPVAQWDAVDQRFTAQQQNPAWQGTIGFLTIGLYGCIGLTIIISATQLISAFRRQSIQLGALRAIGLPSSSILQYYLLLEGLIIGVSTLSGLLTAAGVISLFVPLQQPANSVPPYLVQIDWHDVFANIVAVIVLLVSSIWIVSLLVVRTQLSQSVKLEQV